MPDPWEIALFVIPGWLRDVYAEYFGGSVLVCLAISIFGFAWFLRRLYLPTPNKGLYIFFVATVIMAQGALVLLLMQGRTGWAFHAVPVPLLVLLLVAVVLFTASVIRAGLSKLDWSIGLATSYAQSMMWLIYLYWLAKS